MGPPCILSQESPMYSDSLWLYFWMFIEICSRYVAICNVFQILCSYAIKIKVFVDAIGGSGLLKFIIAKHF